MAGPAAAPTLPLHAKVLCMLPLVIYLSIFGCEVFEFFITTQYCFPQENHVSTTGLVAIK